MPLGREQKLWRASGRVEKWKNNEESYVNKTQQQMDCKQQQHAQHELPTMTRKLL